MLLRINLGRATYESLRNVFKGDVSVNLKEKVFDWYVFPILRNGGETTN